MMKALLLNASSKTATVRSIPIPKFDAQADKLQILIQIEAIALNPVDSLYVSNPIGSTGRTVGSDFAGVIVDISEPAPSPSPTCTLKIGDRVAGLVQGASSINNRPGAFAEYLVTEADLVWKVPEYITLEQAATVSLCGLTAAQGVYFRLGIPSPFEWPRDRNHKGAESNDGAVTVLIYGASTSLGMYVAQLVSRGLESARKEFRLIGTASKARFEMLSAEPYGYDYLVDYRDPGWADKVRGIAGEKGVDYALDCISEGDTVRLVASTLGEGRKMAIFRSREGGAWTWTDGLSERLVYGAVWEGLGVDIEYDRLVVRASEATRGFAVAFYRWLSEGGKLEPNPVRVMPGGLERVVLDGFALLGSGVMEDRERMRTEEWMRPISAEKVVYRIRGSANSIVSF